ncbi:hypothetical protein [Kitasatospora brasiliensis]|uniref:hypothetical protein n=1 Tax=Kitasatospora brasiliensis TaxID=3058040 RepID=UPI00292EA495|nr:hypothetical protein [Kitasatospora sp. K002]
MGDDSGLASAAAAALLGDGPHRAVADVVRARLRMVPEGARALAAVEAAPGDPRARALLTAAVAQLLASDRAFAQYLATTGLGKPSDPTTVHLRTGPPSAPPGSPTTVQLRVDPAAARALAARRSGTGIVAALALVLVTALVALGVHLGSRPLLKPGGPDLPHAAPALRDPAVLRGVLPQQPPLPGWQLEHGPDSGTGQDGPVPCLLPSSCDRQLGYATVLFGAPDVQQVTLSAVSFDSPGAAAQAFAATLDQTPGAEPTAAPLAGIGDQSAARVEGSSAVALVRVGSVLLLTRENDPGRVIGDNLLPGLLRLLAERARAAQQGSSPTP